MSQKQIDTPVIRSFIFGDFYTGIKKTCQYIGINKPEIPTLRYAEYAHEIVYYDDFMHYTMEPIISELNSIYSPAVTGNVVNALLMLGIQEGISNYKTIHKIDFEPRFDLQKLLLISDFGTMYRKLIELFPMKKVDLFCNAIAHYGLAFVKNIEDEKYLYGDQSMYENCVDPMLN